MDAAIKLWESAKPLDYTYVFRRGSAWTYDTYRFGVKNGKCWAEVRPYKYRHMELWRHTKCDGNTMEAFFAALGHDLLGDVTQFNGEFDPVDWHVKHFFIEPKADLMDEGWYVTVDSFKPGKRSLKTP